MTKSLEELKEKLWRMIAQDALRGADWDAKKYDALADEIYRAGEEEAGRNAGWSSLVAKLGGKHPIIDQALSKAARTNKQEV